MTIDLNEASVEDLSWIVGITPAAAEAIIEYRDEQGGFTSLSEVARVYGCTMHTVDMLDQAGVSIGAAPSLEDADGSHE